MDRARQGFGQWRRPLRRSLGTIPCGFFGRFTGAFSEFTGMERTCKKCQTSKPLEKFPKSKTCKEGRKHVCRACQTKAWESNVQNNPDRAAERKWQLRLKAWNRRGFSLTPEEYQSLWDRARGRCEICERTDRLCVDHDHATGKARGILCSQCNRGLGYFKDNKKSLARAVQYLP